MIRPGRPSTLQVVIALLCVYVVWGSTYLAIALMVETLPPLLAAGIRFLIAGALMLGFLWLRARFAGERLARPPLVQWRSTAIVGVLLLLGGNGFVVLSELHIPSGIAAVMVATVPIWLAVLDVVATGQRPSRLAATGIAAGFVGVAILIAPLSGSGGPDPVGLGLVTVAAISWALGSIYARSAPMPRSALLSTGMEMLAGGVALLLAGLVTGEAGGLDPGRFSLPSVAALGYLILFGSIVGFTAYGWLLANVPVSTAATYAYVNPVVAVLLGALILHEPLTPRTVVATVVIVGAVVAMVSGRPAAAEEAGPAPEAASLEG
jgi:drug/metabolite transporter (DMT)-like permease